MLVFYEERLALLSVPKTGSTAYEMALRDRADIVVTGPPDLRHASVRRFDRFFQNMFRKMFDTEMEVMAVVREPIDWLGSWYKYRSRPDLRDHSRSTENLTFEAFIKAYLQAQRPPFADVGCQTDFLRPRSNEFGATHVFKYENQTAVLDFLQHRLKCEINLQHANISPSRRLDLSDATNPRFRKVHAAEFLLHEGAR